MRAVDTSVLIRALMDDDTDQGTRAQACLMDQPVYIPVTVMLELEWVLRSRYGLSAKSIADIVEDLAVLENAVVSEQPAVIAAARKMREGWDFADALHHALSAGCDDFASFDTSLVRRAGRDVTTSPPVIAI